MPTALLKFQQGALVGGDGLALLVVLGGGPVVAKNVDDTGVHEWKFTVIDVPPGSTVPTGVVQDGATPTWTFTPDVSGGYLIQLDVVDGASVKATDLKCVGVKTNTGQFIPPFDAPASALNFAGNPRGWSPHIENWLAFLDQLAHVVNVKSFGAKGDDASNDTAAIMAAYNSGLPANGGTLYFPEGSYLTTGLSFSTKSVLLLGAWGRDGSSSIATNSPSRIRNVTNAPIVVFGNVGGATPGRFSGMRGIGIQGDSNPAHAAQVGLVIDNMATSVEDVVVAGCGGDGIGIYACVAGHWKNVTSQGNRGEGWCFDISKSLCNSPAVTNTPFEGCGSILNGKNGIRIQAGPGAGNAVTGILWKGGFVEQNGANLAISSCPPSITTVVTTGATSHNLVDGQSVNINNVGGNIAANGVWFAKATGFASTSFGLYVDRGLTTPLDTHASGAYTGGGRVLTGWGIYVTGRGGGSITGFNKTFGLWDELNNAGCIRIDGDTTSNDFHFIKIGSGPDGGSRITGSSTTSNATGGGAGLGGPSRINQFSGDMISWDQNLTVGATSQLPIRQFKTIATGGGYDALDLDCVVWRDRNSTVNGSSADGNHRLRAIVFTKGLAIADNTDTIHGSIPGACINADDSLPDPIGIPNGQGISFAAAASAGGGGGINYRGIRSNGLDQIELGGFVQPVISVSMVRGDVTSPTDVIDGTGATDEFVHYLYNAGQCQVTAPNPTIVSHATGLSVNRGGRRFVVVNKSATQTIKVLPHAAEQFWQAGGVAASFVVPSGDSATFVSDASGVDWLVT